MIIGQTVRFNDEALRGLLQSIEKTSQAVLQPILAAKDLYGFDVPQDLLDRITTFHG